MKILVVAPGIAAPWTEGRKNFVMDLLPELKVSGEVSLLTSLVSSDGEDVRWNDYPVTTRVVTARQKIWQLPKLLNAGRKLIGASRPEIVLHFPYGTFDGPRGFANLSMCLALGRVTRHLGSKCLTVLYSATNSDLARLEQMVGRLCCAPTYDWTGLTVFPGRDMGRLPAPPRLCERRKLLFMAGYQEQSRGQWRRILHERGLLDILRAGGSLAQHGCSLTVAVPLLRFTEFRKNLEDIRARLAPELPVNIVPNADPRQLLSEHLVYLFPYKRNLRIFVPTSLIEAIAMGTPTVLPNLQMFHPLRMSKAQKMCRFYEPGDLEGLVDAVLAIVENRSTIMEDREKVAETVRKDWDITSSARQIIACLEEITHGN